MENFPNHPSTNDRRSETNGKRKAENGTDARSKSRGCLQTMPCKKEEKPAQAGLKRKTIKGY